MHLFYNKNMKSYDIVFVGNYLNHHQIWLCDEFAKRAKTFLFISTDGKYEQGFQKRLNASYVLDYASNKEKCEKLIISADICIFGSCPNKLIDLRMQQNKLSFIYTERFFKKGQWRRYVPSTCKKIKDRIIKYKEKNLYVLCAGAYVYNDLSLFGFSKEKCFKWGYFPETRYYENITDLVKHKDPSSIIWCGRYLDWKHPELAIRLIKKLKNDGYNVRLKMIGEGPLKSKIERIIKKHKLSNCVDLIDSLSTSEVRNEMEKALIFLLTSDSQEGWGTVLNEAMNSGCGVVASNKAGSTHYLVENMINGVIFNSKCFVSLYNKTKLLLDDDFLREKIAINATNTICNSWNATIAVNRFLNLASSLLNAHEPFVYKDGVCSVASY